MKYGVWKIITVICVTYMQKDFKIQTLIRQISTKYQFFKKLPQISHIHKNYNFKSIIGTFKTTHFYPLNFVVGACKVYTFSFLPVVSRYGQRNKRGLCQKPTPIPMKNQISHIALYNLLLWSLGFFVFVLFRCLFCFVCLFGFFFFFFFFFCQKCIKNFEANLEKKQRRKRRSEKKSAIKKKSHSGHCIFDN